MSKLAEQYTTLTTWLRANLNERALAQLDSPIPGEADRALAAWISLIGPDGDLEVGAQYSATGRPVIGNFRRDLLLERDQIAADLLDGCPDESLDDHEAIAEALRRGDSAETILGMAETNNWPETYVWLKSRLI